MKMKTIAFAVLTMGSPAATVHAADDPDALWPHFLLRLVGGATGSRRVDRRSRVEDESSLLGVRGTQALGSGLKSFFQLETAFRVD